jgi:phosphatidate cytidylyltransferase
MIAADPVDVELLWLIGGITGVLVVATTAGRLLHAAARDPKRCAFIANLNARVQAWWVICALLGTAVVVGGALPVMLFGAAALLALRELLTLAPIRSADRRALLVTFYVLTPLQFALVATGRQTLFTVFIPVVAFLLVATCNALAGDCERYLDRTAVILWALIACIYNISFVPAILSLEIPGDAHQNAKLLLFLVLVVQASDVLQYVWGTCLGRHTIAPLVSPNKTWEGFIGGVTCATLLGAALWWATPFTPWQAALISLAIALLGFAGGLTMSAIKRDRGVKDFGNLVRGHGGVLDRLDSLCFAAPAFFFMTRYLLT